MVNFSLFSLLWRGWSILWKETLTIKRRKRWISRRKSHYNLLLSITLCLPLSAQPVEIPDPNLRVAIRDALNQPDGVPLNVLRMRQLTRLDVPPDSQIRDLAGLEYATNLTYLALGGNEITDLTPIAGLVKLRFLSVWGSPISDLSPITNLTELTDLYLGYCRTVSDIAPVANLTNLDFLQLRGNRIVDVTALANLTKLQLTIRIIGW